MRLFVFGFMVATCLTASEIPTRGDSGIYGPSYDQILEWQQKIQSQSSELVSLVPYGFSHQQRPLQLMLVKSPGTTGFTRTAVVMTGAIHGNEYLNIEDRLPEELIARARSGSGSVASFLSAGGVLVFVPIVNPDGYESRSRYNAKGVDLNRDWDVPAVGHTGFKQVESAALSNALERLREQHQLRYALTVDYHCCAGALLTPWSYSSEDLPEPYLSQHRAIGELAKQSLQVEVGATSQVLGYRPMGTSKDYYFSLYGALAFTYEGVFRQEQSRLKSHVTWWEKMLAYVQDNLMIQTHSTNMASLQGLNSDL